MPPAVRSWNSTRIGRRYRHAVQGSRCLQPLAWIALSGRLARQSPAEFLHGGQIVNRAELVDMRQHCPDSGSSRLECVEPEKRVQPDQAAAGALEAIHLEGQLFRHFPLEPVREQKNDGALAEHAAGPVTVELVQGMGDPRSALPILHAL